MSFLPFYIPKRKNLNIVIVGGGYAGVSALTTFSRYMPNANITIVDPRTHHIKITHLHETFRYPLQDFMVPFSHLEKHFGCRHICAKLFITEDNIQQWNNDKFITINEEQIDFDYVLIASGASFGKIKPQNNTLDLNSFLTTSGTELLNSILEKTNQVEPIISVVGGGATGIQFLFEIAHFTKRKNIACRLQLINDDNRVLKRFPIGLSKYTEDKMSDLNISFYPNTYFKKQKKNSILLIEKETKNEFELPSSFTLFFIGNNLGNRLSANTFGQAVLNNQTLRHIFMAGDCSNYNSHGSNTMTAQSAVRKGRLAASNILRDSSVLKIFEPYLHPDLGYVISLGPEDAVGWIAKENNVVNGTPALLLKEMVESQYDLLLATGMDTYVM
ncbi:MAG: pyridine nucleotide-disulfide oxidoreductase [Nitrosomonadaceae bacterium]|nr:pyridine nucleotide-disulfide oxidoreductase [Nitrosomonadaceae bacterium]